MSDAARPPVRRRVLRLPLGRRRRHGGDPLRVQDPPGFAGTAEDLDRVVIGLQAVARWLLLPAHVVTVGALAAGLRRTAAVAGLGSVAQLALGRAAVGGDGADAAVPGATPLRLVTANLLLLNRDVEAVGRALLASGADVVCLQELVPRHLDPLRASGLLDAVPHSVVDARPGYHGSAVLSRWPLAGEVLQVAAHPMAAADVRTPAGVVRVVSVHVVNPVSRTRGAPRTWRAQLAELARLVTEAGATPVVLAGDWNATLDHRPLRAVLEAGVRDAWVVAGRGAGFTWPVRAAWWRPPLMRIDHVLVGGGLRVRGARTGVTPGSDHRQVVVDLELGP
ncbi:hypothetical protein GCM10027047_34750 [Rhodococcus aerolatus]